MLRHFFLPHKKNNHRAFLLKAPFLYSLVAAIFGLQLFFSYLSRVNPSVLGVSYSITSQDIIALTNDERGKQGLKALSANGQLAVAAQRKGEDMLAKGYWAHVAPDGKQPWAFIREAGYSYERAGENLAKDFTDSTSTVQAWMNSPGHRANVLNAYYQEIGVAVVSGPMNGRDTVIVVQMFGQPRGGIASLQNPQSAQAQVKSQPEPKGVSVVEEFPIESGNNEIDRPTTAAINQDTNLQVEASGSARQSQINPFFITKTFSFITVIVLLTLLVADAIYVTKNRITHRPHGHSAFHIVFIVTMLVALLLTSTGVIL